MRWRLSSTITTTTCRPARSGRWRRPWRAPTAGSSTSDAGSASRATAALGSSAWWCAEGRRTWPSSVPPRPCSCARTTCMSSRHRPWPTRRIPASASGGSLRPLERRSRSSPSPGRATWFPVIVSPSSPATSPTLSAPTSCSRVSAAFVRPLRSSTSSRSSECAAGAARTGSWRSRSSSWAQRRPPAGLSLFTLPSPWPGSPIRAPSRWPMPLADSCTAPQTGLMPRRRRSGAGSSMA